MSKKKLETVRIGQYKVSKDGRTKYIELGYSDKASKATKDLVNKVIEALGSKTLFVNLFDKDFREKHKIADFIKGSIAVPLENENQESQETSKAKAPEANNENEF